MAQTCSLVMEDVASDDTGVAHQIWSALNDIKDPCHVLSGHDLSIVDLGLINRVDMIGDTIEVGLTFTDSTCVYAHKIIAALEDMVPSLSGVRTVKVVPEAFPLWSEARLSDRARSLYADRKKMFGLPNFQSIATHNIAQKSTGGLRHE